MLDKYLRLCGFCLWEYRRISMTYANQVKSMAKPSA